MGKTWMHQWGIAGAIACLAAFGASAQDAPGLAYVFGHTGEIHYVNNKAFLDFGGTPTDSHTANGITFNLFYEDVRQSTGAGFDDAVKGPAARARMLDVLDYLAATLNETGTLDVYFNLSNNAGNAALASAGTLYFTSPGFNSPTTLFRLKNDVKPAAAFPEIVVTVDFGYNYNLTSSATAPGTFDFFSILLHEFTHGLGFASVTQPDGSSGLAPNARTKYDQFLVKGQGGDNIYNPAFTGTAADLKSNDLFFEGTNATTAYDQAGVQAGIFAPNAADSNDFWFGIDNDNVEGEGEDEVEDGFVQGSSISHWDTFQIVGGAVMEHAISSGFDRREYSPVDVGALVDIGWTLAALVAAPEGEGEGGGEGVIEGDGAPDGEGTVDGEGVVDGSTDGEGTVDGAPDGEGTPDGEGVVDGSSDGEGVVDGEGIVDGEGGIDGEGVVDGEGIVDGEGEPSGTVILTPIADATMYESVDGSTANGAGERLFTGVSGDDVARRALLLFDVAAFVPEGANILSAELQLNLSKAPNGASETFVDVHRVTQSWTEGLSNPLGEEGLPSAALFGDVTWLHRTFNSVLWTTPGGDFFAQPSASTSVNGTGPVSINSDGLADDVTAWLATPQFNFGWVLLGDEGAPGEARRFDSRENPTTGNRPQLVITFGPEPTEGAVDGEGVVDGEGQPGGEGTPDGEGVTDGEGQAGGEGTADGEGTPDGEGITEGDGEGGDPTAQDLLLDFADIDSSGDGLLSLAELQFAGYTLQDLLLLDTNADLLLSVAELLEAAGGGIIHSGDTDGDGAFQLDELLRIIQLFNSDGYACAATPGSTEDGYIVGAGSLSGCLRHAADYLAPAGSLSLSELLRAIQFFNLGSITFCEGVGEDDFCPGT
ncbi:MAG: DNRLRE domain-containing protein [Candidatus Hydrogenedens sp.]|nr:DNRLRE domain-containing protein [Candidatus Hydrogenedens sp.]